MLIDTLPNTFTETDETTLIDILTNNALKKSIYTLEGQPVDIKGFNKDTNELDCIYKYIDFFAFGDELMPEVNMSVPVCDVSKEHYLPPSNQSGYNEFRAGCSAYLVSDVTDQEIQLELKANPNFIFGSDQVVVFNEQVKLPILFCMEKVRPYSAMVNKCLILSDNLEMLLKLSYDNSDFLTEEARKMDLYFSSPEFKLELEQLIDDARTETKRLREYKTTSRYAELARNCKEYLSVEKNVSIHSSFCESAGFCDEDEFHLFIEAACSGLEPNEDLEADFRTFVTISEGLSFTSVHGQGSFWYVSLPE
ncbi:hypothetical protein [Vibrio sp. D431a]|uniref:hypothetical protein n=1 Tax=Vibrio sp. D431a TaxID=2837388 RepID=UPI002556D679|nr:hypothetical protein [Vibrio sp. D431a]MDK9789878.1 hypothetical protein [Vibrio sp. D431a]